MLDRLKNSYYAAISIMLLVLCALAANTSGLITSKRMAVAPASLDGVVTISNSADKKLTFITCVNDHPTFWQRVQHSRLSGAFVVQHLRPMRKDFAHAGRAHIDFQGNSLTVVFADTAQFAFTTAPQPSIPLRGDEQADYSVGLMSGSVVGLDTHAAFVSSRDWEKPGSCGL